MASLIKIGRGKPPMRAVQFMLAGQRRTIRIGRVDRSAGDGFKRRVERLVAANVLGHALDDATLQWAAGLSDSIYGKCAELGLLPLRGPATKAPPILAWMEEFSSRSELKPATIRAYRLTGAILGEFFGAGQPIDKITVADAAVWRDVLGAELSEASVLHHCRNAKSAFKEAVSRELIDANPFRKLRVRSVAAVRSRYVTPEEAARIIECCPLDWRVLFALGRLAGLRVPSETHILTWADVDWERLRLSVYAPKTERYPQHRRRGVPMVPELQAVLAEVLEAAPEGRHRVVTRSANNMHRDLAIIIRRAGIEPFPRVWQTLRQSCETEWSLRFPQHAVSAWMGHSEQVSREHYLTIPDQLWESAAKSAADIRSHRGTTTDRDENDRFVAPSAHEAKPYKQRVKRTAPPGTRTPDPLIKSQRVNSHNPIQHKDLRRGPD